MTDAERSQQAALTGAPMEIIDRLLKERRELKRELDVRFFAGMVVGAFVAMILIIATELASKG